MARKLPVFLLLVVLALLAAGVYGSLHDQISFTVSAEYFTHFKYFQFGLARANMPDCAKAAIIGFLASWWMGLPIGLLVGGMGFIHVTARRMFLHTLKAYTVAAGVAFLVGLAGLAGGLFIASHNPVDYPDWFIPPDLTHTGRYLAVGWMHELSYIGGTVGLIAGAICQALLNHFDKKQPPATP